MEPPTFITAFTSARHLSLSWASSIQSNPHTVHFMTIHLNIVLPSTVMCVARNTEQGYETRFGECGCYWVRETKGVNKGGEGNVTGINNWTSDQDEREWTMNRTFVEEINCVMSDGRCQWPRALRPFTLWDCELFEVCLLWVLCVVKKSGLCDGLITRPGKSYRVWCVWVWSWSLANEETLALWVLLCYGKHWPSGDCWAMVNTGPLGTVGL